MHYYKRNLGDYHKKAGRLTIMQHGVYNLLLDACYDREQFPTRDEAIDWVWAGTPDEIDAVDLVLRKFFTLQDDGKYVQKRIEEELVEYEDFKVKQGQNGKKGGRPRKPTGLNKKPTGLLKQPNANPNEPRPHENKPKKSLTTNQEPLTTNQLKELFESFYSAYPKKTKRQDAERTFLKLAPDRDLTNSMITNINARLATGEWDLSERKFIPNPQAYLNGRRWEDEVAPNENRPTGNSATPGRKPTPAERVEIARQAAYQRELAGQSSPVGAVEAHGGNVRPLLGEPAR